MNPSKLNSQSSFATALYHSDGNGNVTCLIYTNQTFAAKYEYDPYGTILSQSGSLSDANLYRFSSKEYHTPSGLICYLYRYYEPNLQRWLNGDPLAEKGFENIRQPLVSRNHDTQNSYTFVRNMSLNAFDASGLYTAIVKACEIVVLFGHGSSSKPHTFQFTGLHSAGHFVGCESKATNDKIRVGHRITGAPSTDEELYNGAQTQNDPDHSFDKFFNDSWNAAKAMASRICKTGACASVTVRSELAGNPWDPDNWGFPGVQSERVCCCEKK